MITILSKQQLKHNGFTWLEIVESNKDLVVGKNYLLQDYQNWKPFHKVTILHKETKTRAELSDFETLLNNDVDVNLHNKIDALRKPIRYDDKLDILVLKSIQNLNPIYTYG